MRCLHLSAGYMSVLFMIILEEVILLAGAVVVELPDVQHTRGSSCFTLGGKLTRVSEPGQSTHNPMGTEDRVAMRRQVGFLLLVVMEVILLAHQGGWTAHGHILQA